MWRPWGDRDLRGHFSEPAIWQISCKFKWRVTNYTKVFFECTFSHYIFICTELHRRGKKRKLENQIALILHFIISAWVTPRCSFILFNIFMRIYTTIYKNDKGKPLNNYIEEILIQYDSFNYFRKIINEAVDYLQNSLSILTIYHWSNICKMHS